jgi:tryptophan 2,3-dioxygenase
MSTDYEKYLRTDELLSLQKPAEQRVNPEELLFQVIHQSAELWMKLVENEMHRAGEMLDRDEIGHATHLVRRSAAVLEHLARQLPLLESLAPADYHVIRLNALGRGSGQESPGFNRLLQRIPAFWPHAERLLSRRQLALGDVFRAPYKHDLLWQLLQALLQLDESFQSFRYHHFQLVRRIIGDQVKSLKNVPASALAPTTTETSFPALWQAVNDLTRAVSPQYG